MGSAKGAVDHEEAARRARRGGGVAERGARTVKVPAARLEADSRGMGRTHQWGTPSSGRREMK
jgi:hypothetical protein